MYHEATFLHNMLDRANETHHTTALQAADVALKTNARALLIGHFSARYKKLDELLEEAQSIFSNTELAIEGKTFVIWFTCLFISCHPQIPRNERNV